MRATEMANPPPPKTTLYVLVPPSPLFAAHWSFFLPDTLPYNRISHRHEESNTGRRIHVAGDRLNGFQLEMIREYNIRKHRSVGTRRFAIGLVSPHHLHPVQDGAGESGHSGTGNQEGGHRKDEDESGGYVDNTPFDEFERICTEIDAPGPSLDSVSRGGEVRTKKVEARDCQWWIRKVVEIMTSRDMLQSLPGNAHDEQGISPNHAVATLPCH